MFSSSDYYSDINVVRRGSRARFKTLSSSSSSSSSDLNAVRGDSRTSINKARNATGDLHLTNPLATESESKPNQATDLTPVTIEKNDAMKAKMGASLSFPADFHLWYQNVTKILQEFGLHRLIDPEVPRPIQDDPDFEVWFETSESLATWLHSQIGEPCKTSLQMSHDEEDLQLADNLMGELKALFGDNDFYTARRKACFALWDCRKRDFKSLPEYLEQMEERFIIAQNLKTGITAYQVAMMILQELRWNPAYEVIVRWQDDEIRRLRGNGIDMSNHALRGLCTTLRHFDINTNAVGDTFDAAGPRRGR